VIRINLLAQKRRVEGARRSEAGQGWLVAIGLLFVLELVALFVFHGVKTEEQAEQQRKNKELEAQIERSKKLVADHPTVQKELAELREREDAIKQLQSARTGPTAVLLELARLLTPGRGPSVSPDRLGQVRRDNPLAAFNAGWDPRRLWISSFVEQARKVKVEGMASDGEDVSELARRMNLSDYFEGVVLLPGKQEKDKESGLDVVRFSLEAQVKY
jgi:type IV pilus assembly protein PilN